MNTKLTKQQYDLRHKQVKDLAQKIYIQDRDLDCKEAVKRAIGFLADCEKEIVDEMKEVIRFRETADRYVWPYFKKQTNTLLHLAEEYVSSLSDFSFDEIKVKEELLELDWTGVFDQEEWSLTQKEHHVNLLIAYVQELCRKKEKKI